MNESLIKYLAGLLDADGSLSFESNKSYSDGRVRLSLKLHLVACEEIDKTGFVASLPELTGLGAVSRTGPGGRYASWMVGHRAHLEMLLPRVIKHMVIKAQHWQWLLDFWRVWRSQDKGQKSMTLDEWTELQATARQSRQERVGPIKSKNHPTWAWVAGYLDGDGCYSFRTSRNKNMRLSVTAHEKDRVGLDLLKKAFGGTIRPYSAKPHILVWWRGLGPSHAAFCLRFLPKLVRHSRLKRHRIEQMIHFHRQRLSVSAPTGDAIV